METFKNDCCSDIGNLQISCCYRLKGLFVLLLLYLFVSFCGSVGWGEVGGVGEGCWIHIKTLDDLKTK